ncbi:hypothetical protein GCM10017673_01650 [Streptosporangium violaceochromogenes]|nr:hypothetical protein GCM10017673_01650 [Streptosporangium violaceochromogenes]
MSYQMRGRAPATGGGQAGTGRSAPDGGTGSLTAETRPPDRKGKTIDRWRAVRDRAGRGTGRKVVGQWVTPDTGKTPTLLQVEGDPSLETT